MFHHQRKRRSKNGQERNLFFFTKKTFFSYCFFLILLSNSLNFLYINKTVEKMFYTIKTAVNRSLVILFALVILTALTVNVPFLLHIRNKKFSWLRVRSGTDVARLFEWQTVYRWTQSSFMHKFWMCQKGNKHIKQAVQSYWHAIETMYLTYTVTMLQILVTPLQLTHLKSWRKEKLPLTRKWMHLLLDFSKCYN